MTSRRMDGYRNVRWLKLGSGETFGVSLWPPEVAGPPAATAGRDAAHQGRVRVLVFESGSWRATVCVHKARLADFSREEIVRLYRWLRDRSGSIAD